jgi:hypothetical protein
MAWRASRSALVVGALAVAGVGVPTVRAAAQSPVEVVARADAATDASTPDVALGRSRVLLADAAPQRISYLRFEVPVAGSSVRLRVRTSASADAGSPGGFQIARVGAGTWTAETVTFATRPALGAELGRSGPVERNRWVEVSLPGFTVAPGPVELALRSDSADGVYLDSTETGNGPRLLVAPGPPPGPTTLWAVGDVASCATTRDEQVAQLLAGTTGPIALLGDTVYPNGAPDEFARCFDPAWGRYRDRLRPAPGNHEYHTPGAAGYAGYFGPAAGTPGAFWYAYDTGPWRVFVLNSNCGEVGGCGPGSAQYRWFQAELAAAAGRRCTLAAWHHPRFSSGQYGNDRRTEPLWQLFQDAGGDVVLSGHEHFYERFSRMTATGRWDATLGVRSFIVGTGGAELRSPRTVADGSNVRIPEAVGVLRLTLRANDYDWAFVPVGGGAPVDVGTGVCR